MVTAAKLLTVSAAIVVAFTSHVFGAVTDLLPDGLETVGGEVLLLAALLALLRAVLRRVWKFVTEARATFDVIASMDERQAAMDERHATNAKSIERVEGKLDEGSARFGRIETRLDEKRARLQRLEEGQVRIRGALELIADEERQLIRRAIEQDAPEERRRAGGERRDDFMGE